MNTYPYRLPGIARVSLAMVLALTLQSVAAQAQSSPTTNAAPSSGAPPGPQQNTQTAGGPDQRSEERSVSSEESDAGSDQLRLNFRGVPLQAVLEYLSEAAGLIIIGDPEVQGTVTVWSRQPVSTSEAVDLLDTILNQKGYAAIHNGRMLQIVPRDRAHQHNLPVVTGNDPQSIPKRDSMVTQVIPIRFADAVRMVDDLQPLVPDTATITANQSSNAIVLTDTQANIRRFTEIIAALDTSISDISSVQVFKLQYADATQVAEMLGNLFESQTGDDDDDRRRRPWDRDDDDDDRSSGSIARDAASRVVAVADSHSNSVIVSAPESAMPSIADLVNQIDTNVDDVTELSVFQLEHADARETADLITELFSDQQQGESEGELPGGLRFLPRRMRERMEDRFGDDNGNGGSSARSGMRVIAVPDLRTNSVIISAPSQLMQQIGRMVDQLDADSSKQQKVYVYSLEHADPQNVAAILRNMFESQGMNNRSRTGTGNQTSRLQNRAETGAEQIGSDTLGSGGQGNSPFGNR